MVEPLEDTRSELIFATEPLLSSLALSIPGASRTPPVELDEIEVSESFTVQIEADVLRNGIALDPEGCTPVM